MSRQNNLFLLYLALLRCDKSKICYALFVEDKEKKARKIKNALSAILWRPRG